MLKALRIIALVALVAVAAILAYAATQPGSFRVERASVINAPPEKIFAILSDMRRSVEWSPFEKTDPDMKRTYSGAESGKGAIYEWDGNGEAGAGRIEIREASPPSRLLLSLDFTRPMEASNMVEYTLEPQDGATNVAWAIYGPMPFVSKVMCVFFDMDTMIGGEFEKGLADLKTLAEADNTAKAQ